MKNKWKKRIISMILVGSGILLCACGTKTEQADTQIKEEATEKKEQAEMKTYAVTSEVLEVPDGENTIYGKFTDQMSRENFRW